MKLLFVGDFKGGHFQLLSQQVNDTKLKFSLKKRELSKKKIDNYNIDEKQTKKFEKTDSSTVIERQNSDINVNDWNVEINSNNSKVQRLMSDDVLPEEVISCELHSDTTCSEIAKQKQKKCKKSFL